jgi:hypothetical protein
LQTVCSVPGQSSWRLALEAEREANYYAALTTPAAAGAR